MNTNGARLHLVKSEVKGVSINNVPYPKGQISRDSFVTHWNHGRSIEVTHIIQKPKWLTRYIIEWQMESTLNSSFFVIK